MATTLASLSNLVGFSGLLVLGFLTVLLFYGNRLPRIVRSIRSLPKAFRQGRDSVDVDKAPPTPKE